MLRRFSVFSLALLLCLSLFPARALADVGSSSVLWSGSINDGSQFGAFVKGGTRYDAAVAALGYDSSRLSDEVKAKLSDSNYGGMFYVFANAFSSVSSPLEIPSWVPAFVTTSSVIADLFNNISGSNYPHWSVAVNQSVYDLALRDFYVVLNGGDLSGGGSSVVPGQFSEFALTSFNWRNKNGSKGNAKYFAARQAQFVDGVLTLGSGTRRVSAWGSSNYYVSVARLYVSSDVLELANSYVNQGYDVFFYLGFTGLSNEAFSGVVSGFYYGHDLEYYERSTNGTDLVTSFTGSDVHKVEFSSSVGLYYDSTGVFTISSGDSYSISDITTPINVAMFSSVVYGVDNPPPAGDWPEPSTPDTPTAPELPEPAEPVVETPVTPTVPAPVWPDITINIEPDPVPGTTPDGLDYTELLTRINDNLISIDSFARAINSNLNSLRGDLLAEFNGVIDSLRNIYNYLLTIDSVLETHCTHLRNKIEQSAVFIANYMRTLIKWLADQLDYDDMTNVEAPDNSLLTTINEKLGGGTYEPNPIKDEQGYYEWLDDLWDRFLLGDNWQSSMGSISGSFSELKTRFPFSVPWDIVALFRLFVHDPVTPVFDLPLYFSADGSTPVHVDLSPWDSVASLVRPMVFVIFALKLALLSRDLLGGLGADKGGL